MKKLILTATFLVAGVFSTLAQGEMDFSNAPWEPWPDAIDRLVYKTTLGVDPVDDPTWSAQLVQQVGGQWIALGDRANFFGPDLPGIWAADGVKRLPTVSTVAVEIYDGAGAMLVRSPSFEYTRGNSVPPSLADTLPVNLRAFVVPEPSTIALGVLGLGALLLFRRRK